MQHRRIYLSVTADQLRGAAQTRALPAPLGGFAAGAQGRVDARSLPTTATEEAEYVAFRAAAGQPVEGSRRIIVSVDAPVEALQEREVAADEPAPVTTIEELSLRLVASIHIDEDTPQGEGEPDLLWYDVTELDSLVADLDA